MRTRSVSYVSFFQCSTVLIINANSLVVAMLNGREGLKEELQMKSIVTSGFEAYNHSGFRVSKKDADVESDATGAPSSVWMETIRGSKTPDAFGSAQIQVDQKVVVSEV